MNIFKSEKPTWIFLLFFDFVLLITNLIAYVIIFDFFDAFYFDYLLFRFIILFLVSTLIPVFIIGFSISKINFFKKHGINFKKALIISAIPIFCLTLIPPTKLFIKNRKIKIKTNNSLNKDLVVYDTQKAVFYFKKSDIIEFCNNQLNAGIPFPNKIKTFKNFVDTSSKEIITIQNFCEQELPPTDTTQSIRDSSLYHAVMDLAMNNIIPDRKEFKVYDKEKNTYVEYIYIRLRHYFLGTVVLYCYFPDGRMFIKKYILIGISNPYEKN